MEQNVQPMEAPVASKKEKSGSGMKVFAVAMTILALAGIGFGVYGMIKSAQKDEQIANLKVIQVTDKNGTTTTIEADEIKIDNNANTVTITDGAIANVDGLHLIGDYLERRYYLGTTADKEKYFEKDSREIEMYLIDTTKLGTTEGVVKYDIKTVLDKITNEKISSLPTVIAAGTTNATPKANCKKFRTQLGWDYIQEADWTYMQKEVSNKMPISVYTGCVIDDNSELSLGTAVYVFNPQTGEYKKIFDSFNS